MSNAVQKFRVVRGSGASAVLVGCLLVTCAMSAQADLWKVHGTAKLETEFSDNKRLTSEDEDDGFQTTADLEVNAVRTSRTNKISAQAQVEAIRFSGIELQENEENVAVSLTGQHRPTRNLTLGWYGDFARDTTSNREPRAGSQVDENSNFSVDTGLTREQFRTQEFSFGPNVEWQVSENLSLSASYNYRDIQFPDDAGAFGFFDSDRHLLQFGASYALDERHSLSVSARGSLFESFREFNDGTQLLSANVETETIGGSIGYRFDFAENIYFGLDLGLDSVETEANGSLLGSSDTEFVYRIFGVRRGQQSNLLASFSRSIRPSGIGRLVESNLARVVFSYRPDERQTLRLRASYISNKPIGDVLVRLDREFFAIEPGYSYRINRQLSLGINYRYRFRDLRLIEEQADSHSVAANIEYRFGRNQQ